MSHRVLTPVVGIALIAALALPLYLIQQYTDLPQTMSEDDVIIDTLPTSTPTPTLYTTSDKRINMLLQSKYLSTYDAPEKIDFGQAYGHDGGYTRYELELAWGVSGARMSLPESYLVDVRSGQVMPYFGRYDKLLQDLHRVDTYPVTVPGTRYTLTLPHYMSIRATDREMSVDTTPIATMWGRCTHPQNIYHLAYCQEFVDRYSSSSARLQSVDVRAHVEVVEWAGTPYDWTLDHLSFQGSTVREWRDKYGNKDRGDDIQIGGRTYYRRNVGCCGAYGVMYLTPATSLSDKPILIKVVVTDLNSAAAIPALLETLR